MKYNNKKTTIDNIIFDSKKEAEFYCELKLLKRAKRIKDFELQPQFLLMDKFKKNGKRYRAITYKADFKVINNDGTIRIIDIKGVKTDVFKIKQKMFEFYYPEYELEVI